ncbi:TetR/AcrR family transcriptional regulator [Dactylosporangium sp. CA-092794]|uniref:TetR/AcrR family transcriptional regulator n=1 Tax=Dactylosporangium sp. CA-092794 TaxID=3239929 RepID=UPI003D940622
MFGERGLEAPLDEIARRAGVGNATLYRRFRTRGELVAAVFGEALRDVVAATERALAIEDPWAAFAGHLTLLCERQAQNRAFADLLTATVSAVPELERLRTAAFGGLAALAERARTAGVVRADFRPEDLIPVLMANAGLVERTCPTAPTAWRRQLAFILAGLRAPAGTPPGPEPPGPEPDDAGIRQAMHAIAERNGLTALDAEGDRPDRPEDPEGPDRPDGPEGPDGPVPAGS